MRKDPRIFIVTPVFNAEKHITTFLKSVEAQSYKSVQAIIVNDGSTDTSVELIEKSFPGTVVLKGDGNLWWSGCTNLGVEYARSHDGDFVMTVNVDVELDSDCLQALVNEATDHPKTLVGSLVIDNQDKQKVWYFGGYWDRPAGDTIHKSGKLKDVGKTAVAPDWLTGMGALIPISAFNDAGLYDARSFPHYFGDADLSLRAKQQGYNLLVTPRARIFADLSSSWLEKWLSRPRLSFFWNLFFSRRSPYGVIRRYKFYKRHWGPGYRRALWRLYTKTMYPLYKLWAAKFVKRFLG